MRLSGQLLLSMTIMVTVATAVSLQSASAQVDFAESVLHVGRSGGGSADGGEAVDLMHKWENVVGKTYDEAKAIIEQEAPGIKVSTSAFLSCKCLTFSLWRENRPSWFQL
jgi:hypothetical protein